MSSSITLARPRKRGPKGPRPDTRPTTVVTARIDADLAAWADAEAAALEQSRSELIEDALRARQQAGRLRLTQAATRAGVAYL